MIDEAEAGRRLDTLIMVSETTALPVVKNIIADRGSAHGVPADRLYSDPESGGLFARTAHGGRRSTLSGRELDLTATEHDLLCALARNAGGVRSYDDLARRVWQRHVEPKPVRAFLRRLRGKLGDDAAQPV